MVEFSFKSYFELHFDGLSKLHVNVYVFLSVQLSFYGLTSSHSRFILFLRRNHSIVYVFLADYQLLLPFVPVRCDTIHGWLICIWWAASPPPPPPPGSQMVPWMGRDLSEIKFVPENCFNSFFFGWPFCIVWVCRRHVRRFSCFLVCGWPIGGIDFGVWN